ncbi:MAG: mandelate racemase/muconate lactonizing enzyme family protein [Fimbriimonas sp.]
MKIHAVDFFYLRMPEVLDIGDGSQDALLVRVQAGRWTGWGECEASPVVSIASWSAPMSHSACKPVRDSVLGQRLDGVDDIARIHRAVRENGLDMLQTSHTLSGIDMALWDLLGHRFEAPVYSLLGIARPTGKRPYASVLFGDTPEETHAKAAHLSAFDYAGVKFGWGPFGRGSVLEDEKHLEAAREGLGPKIDLMVDAGTVWNSVAEAALRIPALERANAYWLEEPFIGWSLAAHRDLARLTQVPLAAGEGCHHEEQAISLMEFGGVRFIQIDAGRIGGITSARRVAEAAARVGVTYVNHTFTTSLALSASLQPFADHPEGGYCEYPVESSPLARELTEPLERSPDGVVRVPERPGLGFTPRPEALLKYGVSVEIRVGGEPA